MALQDSQRSFIESGTLDSRDAVHPQASVLIGATRTRPLRNKVLEAQVHVEAYRTVTISGGP